MADNGSATNTPELYLSSNSSSAGVFLEVHTQNGNSNASGNNQLAPADFSAPTDATAVPNSAGNSTVFVQGGLTTGSGLFRMKNPS